MLSLTAAIPTRRTVPYAFVRVPYPKRGPPGRKGVSFEQIGSRGTSCQLCLPKFMTADLAILLHTSMWSCPLHASRSHARSCSSTKTVY